MSKAEHNWLLIYAVLICYVFVIGPLNYVLGRKVRDFRITVLFFVVAVFGFGFTLSVLGRRGYGETAKVNILSYARLLERDSYDVTQWVNVFVTQGGYYTITYPGTHSLYSTCQDYEAVNGSIESGRDGRLVVDIPLYSSRPFLHRGKMKGHDLGVRVQQWRCEGRLEQLKLATGPGFPENVLEIWALHGSEFYEMSRTDGHIEMTRRRRRSMDQFLSGEHMNMLNQYSWPYSGRPGQDEVDPEQLFKEMIRPLLARCIGGTESFRHYVSAAPFEKDHVQLFVVTESPEGFELTSEDFGQQRGYVLYHLNVYEPEKPDD